MKNEMKRLIGCRMETLSRNTNPKDSHLGDLAKSGVCLEE